MFAGQLHLLPLRIHQHAFAYVSRDTPADVERQTHTCFDTLLGTEPKVCVGIRRRVERYPTRKAIP